MKKLILGSLVVAFSFAIFATSCSSDNPVSCAAKLTEVTSASLDFDANPSTTTCEAYKAALQDYINCDGIVDKQYYQTELDNLDCSTL